jgi:hypothetical protein
MGQSGHLTALTQGDSEGQQQAIAATVESVRALKLDLTAPLPPEYFYSSLPLCIIDAVFSIGVRFQSVRNTVAFWCRTQGWPCGREDGAERTVEDFLAVVREPAPSLAVELFNNRQRTSTHKTSSISKAEAVVRFAEALHANRINSFAELRAATPDRLDALRAEVQRIPGQRSGISFTYFLMLAGSDDMVKPDRMIRRFVGRAMGLPEGQPASVELARAAIMGAAHVLRSDYPDLTPRRLDYAIWKHESESTRAAKPRRRREM